MGFFSDIFKRLRGIDEDSKISKILTRISNLKYFQTEQTKRLETLKAESNDVSWFNINADKTIERRAKVFTPNTVGTVRTMKDLFEKRRKEEEERIRQLRDTVITNLDNIRGFISNEDVTKAESLLTQIEQPILQLKDNGLKTYFKEQEGNLKKLKELLHQRELERVQKEAAERAERERIEKERIRQAQLKAKREKEEKERQAREYEAKLKQEEQKRTAEIARLTTEVTAPKENSQAFITYLRAHGVTCFYHFTDENNLISIRKHQGLYSWYYCERNGIKIPNAGGDFQSRGLDSRQGLEDYVRLSFCKDHPMAWRKKLEGARLVLLQIQLEVASFKDTQFSNVNAAANNNRHGKSLEDLKRVNIRATQCTYVSREDDIFHEHQAECMVKTFIPIKYITNIKNPTRI